MTRVEKMIDYLSFNIKQTKKVKIIKLEIIFELCFSTSADIDE
jgi:hypothetical protein